MPIAPAKINLFLHVGSARADGYHPIESLVAFADVGDILHFAPGGNDFSVLVDGPFAKAAGKPEHNLVLKAARALKREVPKIGGGEFRLTKNLPAGAGLGGGSSDAAAALRLIAEASDWAAGDENLYAAARETGADVAVCLQGKGRLITGIGEVLSDPVPIPSTPAVLVYPDAPCATPDVYRAFDRMKSASSPFGTELSRIPLQRADFIVFLRNKSNDLTNAARNVTPAIAAAESALKTSGRALLVRMSGSGSAVFALHETMEAAEAEAAAIRAKYPRWWVAAATIR